MIRLARNQDRQQQMSLRTASFLAGFGRFCSSIGPGLANSDLKVCLENAAGPCMRPESSGRVGDTQSKKESVKPKEVVLATAVVIVATLGEGGT